MNSFSLSERRPNPGKGSSAAGISILTAVRRLAVLSIVYGTWKNGFGRKGQGNSAEGEALHQSSGKRWP